MIYAPDDYDPYTFDPIPRAIPRVSRVLGIVMWVGGAVVLIVIGVCVLATAGWDYLEFVK